MKRLAFSIMAVSVIAGISYGECLKGWAEEYQPWDCIDKEEVKKEDIQNKYFLQPLMKKLNKLQSLHAKECAPVYIAKAEAYIDAIDGLKILNPDDGKYEQVSISKMDKIIYKNKAEKYLALAYEKVYSDEDGDGIPCYKEVQMGLNPKVPEKVQKEEKKAPVVKKEVSQKEFVPLKLHARIHFEFNKYTIKKEYLPYLNVITRYLKAHPNLKVKIVGYTDNIGSKEYNQKLAEERAKTIKAYLVQNGISPDRIQIVGKGKEDYLFDNDTPLNRFTNRRAEFFVMEAVEK